MSGSTDVSVRRGAVLADLVPGAAVRDAILVVAYAVVIGATAQIAFPLPWTSVPVTGQTFGVLLGAIVLGSWRAAAGSGLYFAGGLVGIPWYTWAAGAATIGYIIGFVVAAALVGWLAERGFDRRPGKAFLAMALGNLVIYAIGVPYLALALDIPAWSAVVNGALTFVPVDLAKIALATALVPGTWALISRTTDSEHRG